MTKNIAQKAEKLYIFVESCYYIVKANERKLTKKEIIQLNDYYNKYTDDDFSRYLADELLFDDVSYYFDYIINNATYL